MICDGPKNRHASRFAADRALAFIKRRYSKMSRLEPYHCTCGLWHLALPESIPYEDMVATQVEIWCDRGRQEALAEVRRLVKDHKRLPATDTGKIACAMIHARAVTIGATKPDRRIIDGAFALLDPDVRRALVDTLVELRGRHG